MTKNLLFASKLKGLVTNINYNLVIIRRVSANASPDVPKPLYQWGGRALAAQTVHAPFSKQVAHTPFKEMSENVCTCKEM
jgi:hypothetical protein